MIPGNINTALISGAEGGGYQVQRSLRFNSSDSAFLSRTPASAGNRKTWTWAGWVKRSNDSGYQVLFSANNGNSTAFDIAFNGDNFGAYLGIGPNLVAAAVYRDFSAWYHILCAVDTTQATASSRIKLYVNGQQITAFSASNYPSQNFDYDINNTTAHAVGRVSSASSGYFPGYLADIHFIDGQALDPSSFTEVSATTGQLIPKAYSGSFGTNGFWLKFSDNSAATATTLGKDYSGNSNNWTPNNLSVPVTSVTNPVWYASPNLYTTKADVLANATNKGTGSWTASNEYIYLVVNSGGNSGSSNVFGGNFPTTFYPYSNVGGTFTREGSYGATELSSFGWAATNSASYKIANDRDFYILSDTDANPPTGGSLSGTIPALTTSSFRTLAGINAAADSFVDTPTSYGTDIGAGGEVRGNYATLNPLNSYSAGLSNGNLQLSQTSDSWVQGNSTIGVSSGKWYWEVTWSSGTNIINGITKSPLSASYVGSTSDSWGYSGGFLYNNGSSSSYGASLSVGDVIGVALDLDAGTLVFYKNGTSQGQAASGLSGTFFPAISVYGTTSENVNFGQRQWAYAAPSGFRPLVDTLLPAPVVAKPSDYFQTVLYTGNGSTQTISGLGFSPDLVWLKGRSVAYSHQLYDPIRGATNALVSNTTAAEAVYSGGLTAFNSDGFTIGNDGGINQSSSTFVAWTWDAGTTTTTNTVGSITSQVRANASAGFSVVTYSGSGSSATVGHGLGVAPQMVIAKRRNASGWDWPVWHSSLTSGTYTLFLDLTNAQANRTDIWDGVPTSSVFKVNTSGQTNDSAGTYVAYCFAPVAGYSSFGSYTGNGSADGPFVYTGFRPRWILHKSTSSESFSSWHVYDTARDAYNPVDLELYPNLSNSEGTIPGGDFDILSNGFKVRTNFSGGWNTNGITYIYAAFAETPFAYSRAR